MITLIFYGRLLSAGALTYGAGNCDTHQSIGVLIAVVCVTLAVILAPVPVYEYRD